MAGIDLTDMKAIKLFGVPIVFLLMTTGAGKARIVETEFPNVINSNRVTVTMNLIGEAPEWMAVVVQTNDPLDGWQKNRGDAMAKWQSERATNANARHSKMTSSPPTPDYSEHANWLPFKTNLLVDLGPGDGKRILMFGYRYKGQASAEHWNGSSIVVQASKPIVVFTNPKETVTSQPIIQLTGYTSTDLGGPLRYEIFDEKGVATANGLCLVNDRYYDKANWRFTTNYFTCYDLQLSSGTNNIVLKGRDVTGFSFTTNFVCVFTTNGDTSPPVITPNFPQNGASIQSDAFIATGMLDDPSAHLTGTVSADGQTQGITFRVGRSGDYYSVEELPVRAGTNHLTLTATDAAGNSSTNNLVFYDGGGIHVSMDPFDPYHPIGPWITVTGKVSPANCDVWVNGVQAKVKSDGTWRAEKLPDVRPHGGWTFDMTAIRLDQSTNEASKLNQMLSAQASLSAGTNTIVLNASVPACGVFQVHLMGTTGRNFILEASTNLVEWSPILTNALSNPTFDYTDTNANNYHCRFFRVVPLP